MTSPSCNNCILDCHDIIIICSVVMTTEPTPPSWCFTVFSAVFLGAHSWKPPTAGTVKALFLMRHHLVHLNATSFDPTWTHGESSWWHCLPSSARPLSTRKRKDCRDSRDSQGTVLNETFVTVSLSAPPTVACSEQLTHSRTARTMSKPRHPPVSD